MAKSAYIGVNGIARKVKKIYYGVESTARKVKKGYIGVGGVARLWFGSDLVNFLGSVASLENIPSSASAASTGDYALFAGLGSGYKTAVEAISKSFVHSAAPDLKKARNSIGSGRVGDYAVFAGGSNNSESSSAQYDRTEVDAYSSSLVKKNVGALSAKRAGSSSANVGDYLLFGNGNNNNSAPPVDAYSSTLTQKTVSALSCPGKCSANGASTPSYALFGGAQYTNLYTGLVDAYSSSLVKSAAPNLSAARSAMGASVGEYALYIGGRNVSGHLNTVDGYTDDLVIFTVMPLSVESPLVGKPTNSGNYLIIPLCDSSSPYNCIAVDVYSSSLVKSSAPLLPSRFKSSGVALGKNALFFGGYSGSSGAVVNQEIYAYCAESAE